MGLLDDLKRILGQQAPIPATPPPEPPQTSRPVTEGATRSLGEFKATLLAVEDPYVTDVRNGHCSDAYLRGAERLLAVEFRLEHGGQSDDHVKIGGHKLHLFDDADYLHEPIGLDSRSRAPRLVEGFLMPGGAARGWVTFALAWDRQPKRLQMFTGYIGKGVCCWDLPVQPEDEWLQHRQLHRAERLESTSEAVLEDKRAATAELEAQAALAELLLSREDELGELEARASEARKILERLQSLEEGLNGPLDPNEAP